MSQSQRGPVEVLASDAVSMNVDGQAVSAEQAYRTYVMTGMRSLRRTADLLGLPHGTVLSWSQRYSWRARLRDTDLETIEGAAEGMVMLVVGQAAKTVQTFAEIRDDPEQSGMARVEAGKSLMREYQNILSSFGGALSAGTRAAEIEEEDELEALVQTPEGVQVLLERNRERTGRA